MTHFMLAFSHPQGSASMPGTGTYWFALGILVGMATVWFTPGLVKSLVVVFDLVALGWSAVILHYSGTGMGRWMWVAAVFLLIGMALGVVHGLRHLGEAEYRGRKTSIRRIGGWL
jgi:hypothetical protein